MHPQEFQYTVLEALEAVFSSEEVSFLTLAPTSSCKSLDESRGL